MTGMFTAEVVEKYRSDSNFCYERGEENIDVTAIVALELVRKT